MVSPAETLCCTLTGSSLVTAPPFGRCVRKNSATSFGGDGTLMSYFPGLLGLPGLPVGRSGAAAAAEAEAEVAGAADAEAAAALRAPGVSAASCGVGFGCGLHAPIARSAE